MFSIHFNIKQQRKPTEGADKNNLKVIQIQQCIINFQKNFICYLLIQHYATCTLLKSQAIILYPASNIFTNNMNQALNTFLREIDHYSYAQKYRRWQQYLNMESQSENYLFLLGHFLETFPFNYKYWFEYIQLTKFQQYKTALKRNPKSFQLWVGYIGNFKLTEQNREQYKKELQAAIQQIGADSRSLFLYEAYYQFIGQSIRYQFFKKIFTRGLIDLENMYERFKVWFQSINDALVKTLAIKQLKNLANSMSLQEQRAHLRELINNIYSKTIIYREARLRLEDRIKHHYFDGTPQAEEQRPIWRELIQLERANGVVENISYCYERSLMALTDDIQHWEEVFHYMENETNKYAKVLSTLRNNELFFLKFDVELYFYWCDLEERDVVNNARNMYQKISKIKPTYEVFSRWIQLQIRDKKLEHAKQIYDNLVSQFQTDLEMISHILVEYAEFIIKYYKDFDYPKKLLKTYFDHLPFNQYLCLKYLQFMKNFQNKEGYYEQLMQIIYDSIIKARKTLNHNEFASLIKTLKYFLRSTLSSIYLIKISEQKMLQVEEKINKINLETVME